MEKLGKMKRLLPLLTLLLLSGMNAWGQQGKIHGTVREGNEPQVGLKVMLMKEGKFTGQGLMTDDKGQYTFYQVEPGMYSVKVIALDNSEFEIGAEVSPGESQQTDLAIQLSDENRGPGYELPKVDISGSKEIFNRDRQMTTISRKEIREFSGPRDINTIVASSGAPIVQRDHGDPMSFKGARENANATYFDGMKIRGSDQLPLGSIEQVSIMSDGVPAEYGDALGAVIVVTTRNPSMYMGHTGRPLTKTEKQVLKQQRKRANGQGQSEVDLDMVCL